MAPKLPTDDRYRLLVEAVRDYAIYLLDANGMVSSWNPGAERFKGYSAREIIGKHFSVFYTDEDRAAGIPRLALETAAREGRFEAEGWRVRKDGSRFWCSVVIDPVHDDQGVLIGFAKVTRDVTEQKQHRDELQAARDAMHHAQRLESIGRLTGGVAHDFNNFLTAIRFSAEFMKRSPTLPPALLRYVNITIETTERAAQLTRKLLAYARKQPLQPHAFDVRECLSSLRQIFEATLGSSVAVSYEFGPGNCTIRADPGQLESALLNLVINARDAMPSGGQLVLSVKHVDLAQVATPAGQQGLQGPHVALSVRDTGTGIAEDVVSHIFEPFYSTKSKHDNSGLGLSQVQGFVRQSGGDVVVDSVVGKGTTFTLYMPAAPVVSAVKEVIPATGAVAPVAAQHEVLLVEDNRMVGEVVSTLLTDLGQNLAWATDAEQALRLLEQKAGQVDIAILDIVLPGMDGVKLAQIIRSRWPAVRIILATGYSEALAGREAGEFPIMQKPYSVEALTQLLVDG